MNPWRGGEFVEQKMSQEASTDQLSGESYMRYVQFNSVQFVEQNASESLCYEWGQMIR